MKTLLIRAVSALIALLLLWAVVVWFGSQGVLFLISIAILQGIREGSKLFFADTGKFARGIFTALAMFLYLFGIFAFDFTTASVALIFVCLFPIALISTENVTDLDAMMRYQTRALMGLFYLAILPLFACHLLQISHGLTWFLALLSFVFTGDTCAYLVGWKFGKRLLVPSVSPKKTQEGSVGGLVGSAIAGALFHLALPHVPAHFLILLAVVVGALGQMGDLFESLLKRVANIKDSGSLMPGHGGVLDRIDGVLFGAPLMFIGASLLEKWF